jgi:hypothetical protein
MLFQPSHVVQQPAVVAPASHSPSKPPVQLNHPCPTNIGHICDAVGLRVS